MYSAGRLFSIGLLLATCAVADDGAEPQRAKLLEQMRSLAEQTKVRLVKEDQPADFLVLSDEAWLHVFEEKTNGYVRCLRHAVPVMKGRGWGRIINVSGLAGRQPKSTTITVGVNNAAVLNLTKSLSLLLAADNILVNAVLPYIIDTETQDETMARVARLTGKSEADVRKERTAHITVGRMGRPEEVADVIAFLASAKSSYVTGAGWHVDGGAYGGI